jgi:hypothetical protein
MNDRKEKDKKHSSEVSTVTYQQTVRTWDLSKHVQPGKTESFLDHALRLLESNVEPSDARKKKEGIT